MAKQHGARQQKRLVKQKAKRAEKQRQLARATSNNPAIRLRAAAEWPVVAALEPEHLWDTGIGNLLIARRAPGGRIVVGAFLVDVFCLGVKDAFWKETSQTDYEAMVERVEQRSRLLEISPERFSKLVYQSVDYAQSVGLPPHPDFHSTRHILDGIDPSLCVDEFEFGQKGKPYYIRGPSESLAKARAIASRVNAAGGHYIIPVDPATASGLTLQGP